MKHKQGQATNYKTIRSRLTGVVVVPSVVLLVMWALFSSYTVFDGFYLRAVASGVRDASIPAVHTFALLQKERELSMTSLAKPGTDLGALRAHWRTTDEAVTTMRAAFGELAAQAPPEIVNGVNSLSSLLDQLPQRRAQLEAGNATKTETYDYYNSLLDAGKNLFNIQARVVPDHESVQHALAAVEVFQAADWMSRAGSVASGALAAGKFTPNEHREFVELVGAYHTALTAIEPYMLQTARDTYKGITDSAAWKRHIELENRLVQTAERPAGDITSLANWQASNDQVSSDLIELTSKQARATVDLTLSIGERKFNTVLIGSLIALLAVIIGITIAVRISNRLVSRALITRLTSLRQDALTLAHERLPSIVGRLRTGEQVDVHTEVPPLDYGNDEIGQVADAFNAAQYTAVAAAVKESQAREGINRVFLDIAHRNQGLVHRQLKLLDHLEREEENPDQLDSLFQLDHLATRARRNAENLIILAGEQPGRQWRKPVRLSDILRSAVAETEQYARVRVHPVPDRALVGVAVADTIHLIAELVDNATAFSSPRSEVQVHSSLVPHGIVIEVEDHGLGMTQDERDRANAMLAFPPEFDAMAFKGESRLGLFVVARLAAKRGVKVELRESPYGGTVALVVLPHAIVAENAAAGDFSDTTQLPLRTFHDQIHGHSTSPSPEGAGFPGGTAVEDNRLDPRPAEHQVTSESSSPSASARPELPRRRRQQNLAPQLARDDQPQPTDASPPQPVTEHSAERTRRGLSAFQQGTRDARAEGAPSA